MPLGWNRVRVDGGVGVLTAVVMGAFVVLFYVAVVIGLGRLLGDDGAPDLWLSVLATALVALAFEPVRSGVRGWVARRLGSGRIPPDQVLAGYLTSVTGRYPAAELPTRMAKVLFEGTRTARAEVWLAVNGTLECAAHWPPDPDSREAEVPDNRRRTQQVREGGQLLGALTLVLRPGQQLTPVEERLFGGLAAQSAIVLRTAGLRESLNTRLVELEQRTAELRTARRALVARQDAERQRLERNIHDGAQQQVIALLVNLRLAQTLSNRSAERAGQLLADQPAAVRETIETLTELTRGLFPRALTESGPETALRGIIQGSPIPVLVRAESMTRHPPDLEATIYFCCLEAIQNATKHSRAATITVTLIGRPDRVEFSVSDDGAGFTPGSGHGGLAGIRDRVESVRGDLTIRSAPGSGTTVAAVLPIGV